MKTATFKPLTNRADQAEGPRFALPADGFIQLVPKGAAPNVRDDGARIIQLVDEAALQSMYNRALSQGGEVLIDFEHFSHDAEKATDAAAWQPLSAEHLQVRDDGLYGKPRWSEDGEKAVTGGRLRFISPEFPDDDALLQRVDDRTFRPLAVTGFGLTNRPGFKRHSKPLTNSGRPTPADKPNTNMHKTLLALALGLPETELEKLDETTLRNRVQALKDKAVKTEQVETELQAIKNREADAFITTHDAVLPKAESVRKHVRETFLSNRELAADLVASYGQPGGSQTAEQRERAERKPLHNRNAQPPETDAAKQAAEARRAAVIRNRANEIAAKEKIPFGQAWQRATAENPAS